MYFAAAMLAILSGLFYAAGHNEIGSLGVSMCRYGSSFCDNPLLRSGRRRSCGRLGRVRQRALSAGRVPENFRDDVAMPVICPTSQMPGIVTRGFSGNAVSNR